MLWLSIAEDVYTIQIGSENENIRHDLIDHYVIRAGDDQTDILVLVKVSRLEKKINVNIIVRLGGHSDLDA